MSALQLSRDLDVQYKTAFVMAHKLREAMAAEDKDAKVSGEVEIDGMYTGGYVKPANVKDFAGIAACWRTNPANASPLSWRASATARPLPLLPSPKPPPCLPCMTASLLAARSMPTKPRIGTRCTPHTRQSASITVKPTER